jgi:hypothetical protein
MLAVSDAIVVLHRRGGQQNLTGGVSTIGAVARYGPSDDFNNQETTKAAFGMGAPSDAPPEVEPDQSETPGPRPAGFEPAPWYRSPPLLIAWVLLVLILIALIVYGVGELIGGNEGTSPAPSSTTTSTTAPTTTTQPPVSTTTETTPPPTSEVPPPTQQQPTQQPTNQPTPTPTKHHPHLPTLPPGIKLPF